MKFTEEMQQVIERLSGRNGKYPVAKGNATRKLASMERWQLQSLKEAGVRHVE